MYTEQDARQLVVEAGLRLVEEDLVSRTWGNISARISEDEFVITPSGRTYESTTPEDLVVVRISDLSYEGDIRPSSEKGVHAEAYKLRSDIDFIVHTHQFYASVLAAECMSTRVAPCAKYAPPGSARLIRNVGEILRMYPVGKEFLMARHGALILGKDPEEAFRRAAELEEESKKLFLSRVPEMEVAENGQPVADFSLRKYKYRSVVRDQYIMQCCEEDAPLKPYLDDFAQIVGPDAACVENDAKSIKKALIGRNAVLVKGVGAVCTGTSIDDLDAVAMILSKNAASACYVRNAKPLSMVDAMSQRTGYLSKYSKQKDKNVGEGTAAKASQKVAGEAQETANKAQKTASALRGRIKSVDIIPEDKDSSVLSELGSAALEHGKRALKLGKAIVTRDASGIREALDGRQELGEKWRASLLKRGRRRG